MASELLSYLIDCFVLSAVAALPAAGQVIYEDIKIVADDGGTGDWFGSSVAVFGTTAIVGAPQAMQFFGTGLSYLFDTTTGEQLFRLTASDGFMEDRFGVSVAISDTTAIVGAHTDDDGGSSSGSVYVFDTTAGQELFKLTASDAAEGDLFGISVSMSGSTAIVGAIKNDGAGSDSGAAYVFDTNTGEQLFRLTASDATAYNWFGYSVAISGTTAIVGAHRNDDNAPTPRSGAAYLFDTTTGEQLFRLAASDASVGDNFGISVAISGTTAIVGAKRFGGGNSGVVYLFDTTTGQELFRLTAFDVDPDAVFDKDVAISGTTALVAMHGFEGASAAIFDTITGEFVGMLAASEGSFGGGGPGNTIAVSGTTVIGGSFYDNVETGSAYVFFLCPADLNDDGSLNFSDVIAFLNAFAAQDPVADFTGDGRFNFFDVSAFLSAFSAGCP